MDCRIYYCISVKFLERDNALVVIFLKSHFSYKIYVEVFVNEVSTSPT